jgi:8-oxo-dGTP pyrophosphatase MutT (NUDIX family)
VEPRRKRAACTLIQRQSDGAVLSVSRGHDTSDWGLPGGRVERNEALPEAAERELAEETGVRLHPHSKLRSICNGLSGNHIVTIYSVEGRILIPPDGMRSIPFEGYAEWMPPQKLCEPTCTFAEFQRNLFSHFGII